MIQKHIVLQIHMAFRGIGKKMNENHHFDCIRVRKICTNWFKPSLDRGN